MRGNYDGKTAEEVREDLLKAIRLAKAMRDGLYDFNDKYDELLRYSIPYNNDTFKEERDERRKERIKLNMYDVRELAKILGKKVYFDRSESNSTAFPWRGYFYFDDAEISAYYAEKELKEEEIDGKFYVV